MGVCVVLQMCTDGVGCKRRVCFFAHAEAELRKPEEDPVWLQQQMQAEMAAGVDTRARHPLPDNPFSTVEDCVVL